MVYPGLYGIIQYMVRGLHGISRLIWDHTIYMRGLHGISRFIWDHTIYGEGSTWYIQAYYTNIYGEGSTWYIQAYLGSHNIWYVQAYENVILNDLK